MYGTKTKAFMVRVESQVLDALNAAADKANMGREGYVRKLIAENLKVHEWRSREHRYSPRYTKKKPAPVKKSAKRAAKKKPARRRGLAR